MFSSLATCGHDLTTMTSMSNGSLYRSVP